MSSRACSVVVGSGKSWSPLSSQATGGSPPPAATRYVPSAVSKLLPAVSIRTGRPVPTNEYHSVRPGAGAQAMSASGSMAAPRVVDRMVSPMAIGRAPEMLSFGGRTSVGFGPFDARMIARVVTSSVWHVESICIPGIVALAWTSYRVLCWVIRAIAVRSSVFVGFSVAVSVTATLNWPSTSAVCEFRNGSVTSKLSPFGSGTTPNRFSWLFASPTSTERKNSPSTGPKRPTTAFPLHTSRSKNRRSKVTVDAGVLVTSVDAVEEPVHSRSRIVNPGSVSVASAANVDVTMVPLRCWFPEPSRMVCSEVEVTLVVAVKEPGARVRCPPPLPSKTSSVKEMVAPSHPPSTPKAVAFGASSGPTEANRLSPNWADVPVETRTGSPLVVVPVHSNEASSWVTVCGGAATDTGGNSKPPRAVNAAVAATVIFGLMGHPYSIGKVQASKLLPRRWYGELATAPTRGTTRSDYLRARMGCAAGH